MRGQLTRIIILGLLGAVLSIAKITLAFLPNIEIVSLLIIIYTLKLRTRAFASVFVFILIEGLLYGFGIWWFCYLYTWPLLIALTLMLRKYEGKYTFILLNSTFGLFFGACCSVAYLFIGGTSTALSFWASGIMFDLLHCFGNFVIAFALFEPVHKLFDRHCPTL